MRRCLSHFMACCFLEATLLLITWASNCLIQLGTHGWLRGLWRTWISWVVSREKGPSSILLLTMGIRVSFSWGAVSPLCGGGTRELGLRGVFCHPSIVRCHLHFRISRYLRFGYDTTVPFFFAVVICQFFHVLKGGESYFSDNPLSALSVPFFPYIRHNSFIYVFVWSVDTH